MSVCVVGWTGYVLTISKATSRIAVRGKYLFRVLTGYSRFRLHGVRVLLSLILFSTLCLQGLAMARAATINLSSDTETATAGYFRLHWQALPGAETYILQESLAADFSQPRPVYQGPDTASVISGKTDNVYFYRVISAEPSTTTSNTVGVTVAHHSLNKAFTFFAIGAVVFIATLLLIVSGNRRGE